jgi:group I intron endonuclease
MEACHSGVYEIINKVNGHRYIGSSVNVANRLWRHRRHLLLGQHCNVRFQRAWNKYGEENFEFRPLLYCDPELTLVYEQICLNGMQPEYNLAKDAVASARGRKFSDEHKKKLSDANKGKHPEWVGRHHTDETKARMRKQHKPRGPLSEDHKQKLRIAILGKTRSEETRHHMSEGATRRWAKERGEA